MKRLENLNQQEIDLLLEEIKDEIEACEIGLSGKNDPENTRYLIARRRHAKKVLREVEADKVNRFGAEPPKAIEDPKVTIARLEAEAKIRDAECRLLAHQKTCEGQALNARLKHERMLQHDSQFADHARRVLAEHPAIWNRITSTFNPMEVSNATP